MNSEIASFSGDKSYDFTEKISFPRLFASKGNSKVRKIIKEEFHRFGYKVLLIHKFMGSFRQLHFMNLIIVSIIFANVLFLISYFVSSVLNLVLFVLMLIFMKYLISFAAKYDKDFKMATKEEIEKEERKGEGKSKVGENIYTMLKCSGERKRTIVFMAHYDSKSQGIGILTRMICFMILYFVGLITPFLVIVGTIWKLISSSGEVSIIFDAILVFLTFVIVITASMNVICFITTGNHSFGSIDNGTSLATVIELARIFKISPPKHTELVFICTDAEEIGLLGSKALVKDFVRREAFDKESTYIVNFECVGLQGADVGVEIAFGLLSKVYSTNEINEYIFKAAKEEKIKMKKITSYIGSVADHIPFLNNNYKTTMIIPEFSNLKLNLIHTAKDNMDLVDKEKLQEVGLVVQRFVQVIDEELEEK